jgi:hypothetical protein
LLNIRVFWIVTLHRWGSSFWQFEGSWCLYLQGSSVSPPEDEGTIILSNLGNCLPYKHLATTQILLLRSLVFENFWVYLSVSIFCHKAGGTRSLQNVGTRLWECANFIMDKSVKYVSQDRNLSCY